jgi:hypothetical protein
VGCSPGMVCGTNVECGLQPWYGVWYKCRLGCSPGMVCGTNVDCGL